MEAQIKRYQEQLEEVKKQRRQKDGGQYVCNEFF